MFCPKCRKSNVSDRTIHGTAVPLAKRMWTGGHPVIAAVLAAMQVTKVVVNLSRDKYQCRDCGHTFN